jgi:hypothetical protein
MGVGGERLAVDVVWWWNGAVFVVERLKSRCD